MPTLLGTDGYPLWDTFEVSLFLLAGVMVGLVSGFLFPSLWRAVRRRIRSTNRYSLHPAELEGISLQPPWLVEAPSEPPTLAQIEAPQNGAEIDFQMVFARALGQLGQLRDSVQIYLEILKSPAASSVQIGRIYFELAQVYEELGLIDRALALAKEYQILRPRSVAALTLRARLAKKARQVDELLAAAKLFRGNIPSDSVAGLDVAHSLCLAAEALLLPTLHENTAGFHNPPGDIETQLEAAETLAPGSLRMRHVRATLSLAKTLAQAQSKTDELWVLFFGEMSKRIHLNLEYGLPYAPSLALLRQIASKLLQIGPIVDAEAQNAKSVVLREWQQPALQKRFLKEFESLSLSLVLSEPATNIESNNYNNLSEFWKHAFPNLATTVDVERLASQENPWKISCAAALRVAITQHSCRTCRHVHSSFDWTCLKCGARETLVASHLLEPRFGF